MRLRFLGKGGSDKSGCPSLYATDRDTYLVQAWQTDTPETVELPHLLLGYLEPDTFIGATMTDTNRGTFRLTGRPITDHETLSQLDLASDETAIEVPKSRRVFYGAATNR